MSKLPFKVSLLGVLAISFFGGPIGIASAPTANAQQNIVPTATTTPTVVATDALACNCWSFVKSLIPSLPNTALLKTNTTPRVGAVAIFDYNGLPHYGVITALNADGFELRDSNYQHCKFLTHFVSWTNAAITGFWAP